MSVSEAVEAVVAESYGLAISMSKAELWNRRRARHGHGSAYFLGRKLDCECSSDCRLGERLEKVRSECSSDRKLDVQLENFVILVNDDLGDLRFALGPQTRRTCRKSADLGQ
jgi:hypothetical protein